MTYTEADKRYERTPKARERQRRYRVLRGYLAERERTLLRQRAKVAAELEDLMEGDAGG